MEYNGGVVDERSRVQKPDDAELSGCLGEGDSSLDWLRRFRLSGDSQPSYFLRQE